MLASHIRFLANVSKDAAPEKKTQRIREIHSLSKLPHRYPFFEADFMPANKYHKMFVANWYLILYQIQDDTVYVELHTELPQRLWLAAAGVKTNTLSPIVIIDHLF